MKRKYTTECENCKHIMPLTASILEEQEVIVTMEGATDIFPVDVTVIATYIKCPSCGEKNLKQLDTEYTQDLAKQVVKLKLRERSCKKLSDKQKKKLLKLNTELNNIRENLNDNCWDKVYQELNK